MKRAFLAVLALSAGLPPVVAQESRPFEVEKTTGFQMEGLLRQEWTREFFNPDDPDLDRQRARILPRVISGGERFTVGFGADINYSSDENTEPPEGQEKRTLIRDNYNSRDARLDLAFAQLKPAKWLEVEGGRFIMPIGLTEMIWDRDLRPQGGAVRLKLGPIGDIETLSGTFLMAQGSHVFDDDDVRMILASANARLKAGVDSHLDVTASYIEWHDLHTLEPMIRRQNTRDANGEVPDNYRVFDVVGRMHLSGTLPLQLLVNVAWNTEIEELNRGLWLGAVLGSLTNSRARAEYTFASVDKDVTSAAYSSDDFFWNTGWAGHRLDLGTRISDRLSTHAIGQLQRFKDSANEAERDHWVQRFRLEIRFKH
jgi:hypothetical protein